MAAFASYINIFSYNQIQQVRAYFVKMTKYALAPIMEKGRIIYMMLYGNCLSSPLNLASFDARTMAMINPIPIKNPYQFITLKSKSIATRRTITPANAESAIIVFFLSNSIPKKEKDFFTCAHLYFEF